MDVYGAVLELLSIVFSHELLLIWQGDREFCCDAQAEDIEHLV